MGSDFKIVGTASLSSTGRSIRFKITPSFSIFEEYYYISVKDLENVFRKHKKNATIWVPKEK